MLLDCAIYILFRYKTFIDIHPIIITNILFAMSKSILRCDLILWSSWQYRNNLLLAFVRLVLLSVVFKNEFGNLAPVRHARLRFTDLSIGRHYITSSNWRFKCDLAFIFCPSVNILLRVKPGELPLLKCLDVLLWSLFVIQLHRWLNHLLCLVISVRISLLGLTAATINMVSL